MILLSISLGLSLSVVSCGVLPYPANVQINPSKCRPIGLIHFVVNRSSMMFSCPTLAEAIDRHTKRINMEMHGSSNITCSGELEPISKVVIDAKYCDSYIIPPERLDESYSIIIPESGVPVIKARQLWGINYGLQTFGQLIVRSLQPYINVGTVEDSPKYIHRGLMLDTSRHFIPVDMIKMHLDAMSYCKLNVFHWHISDDESFPYQSIGRPEFARYNSFHPVRSIYTVSDIREIREYARSRGIRLVLELDSPGHTQSWDKSALTKCENSETDDYQTINPASDYAWESLGIILKEFEMLNPGEYVHLGADEVNMTCWQQNNDITALMSKMGIDGNYGKLLEYYAKRVVMLVKSFRMNTKSIFWDDILDYMDQVPDDVIIQVWRGAAKWDKIKAQNISVIYSECFYISYISYGDDWQNFYKCDMDGLYDGTVSHLLIGGEACLWGEFIDESNSLARTWPRAAVVAERLWTPSFNGEDSIAKRLDDFTCLLRRRGIPAQPVNSKAQCPVE